MPEIDSLLRLADEVGASDIHIKSGYQPRIRVSGTLEVATAFPVYSSDDVWRLTTELMTATQIGSFGQRNEIDFTHGIGDVRFRCACFRDQNGPGAVLRRIPAEIATIVDLHLPEAVMQFAHLHRGLVLVTGSSGSGKSATMAAILDLINTRYHKHIITLEDPIEYVHRDRLGVVHQRGMYDDFEDFEDGIVAALRQDPDVLVIGELRDLESIRRALTAAETGMLVFGTLHTNGAADSIDRVIDVFPSAEQAQVRVQLSECLAGVVSQVLVPRDDEPGRIPATEILVATPAVGGIIREGKTQDIANVIQSGKSRGMHTLDDSLERLVKSGKVTAAEAVLYARNKGRFERSLASRR